MSASDRTYPIRLRLSRSYRLADPDRAFKGSMLTRRFRGIYNMYFTGDVAQAILRNQWASDVWMRALDNDIWDWLCAIYYPEGKTKWPT